VRRSPAAVTERSAQNPAGEVSGGETGRIPRRGHEGEIEAEKEKRSARV
jgi:hypothetical protein